MRSIQRFLARLLNSALRRRDQQRLREEIEQHLALETADNVRSGLSPSEARRQAVLKFGAVEAIKEQYWAEGGLAFCEIVFQDFRFGWRSLAKSPGFTAVAMITLALGIGANTAIFSMVDTLMLRPLPVERPLALTFLVFPRDPSHFDPQFSGPEFRQLREQTRDVFSAMSAVILGGLSGPGNRADGLTVDGVTRPAQTFFASGEFFPMLGIRPYRGRFILPSEGNAPAADPVVVLSYRYWQSRFRGDPGVLGKAAYVNGHPATIVGIAPEGFLGPMPLIDMEAYFPLNMMTVETAGNTDFLTAPQTRDLLILARLAPGVSVERANLVLASLAPQFAKQYPRPGVGAALEARPLRAPGLVDGPNPLPALAGLFLALAGMVFALACLNVANLSLVRAIGRKREMALRAALGGSRVRLIRRLSSETILLSLFGAAAGVVASSFALRAMSSFGTASALPFVFEFPFNLRVFLYALGIAVLAAAIVGLVPALRISRGNLSDILHEGGRTLTPRGHGTRSVLVTVQVAGSAALLIVAGLFLRSLESAQHADLGFDPTHVLNVAFDPGESGYSEVASTGFYRRLLARTRALPGVQAASLAMIVPFGDNVAGSDVTIPGQVAPGGEQLHADRNAVSPDYFKTMSIALLRGRDFLDSDSEASPPVAIINEAMAQRFWPGVDPVGRIFERDGVRKQPIEIVGVVRNSRHEDVYSPISPEFYVPISQDYTSAETLEVRTSGPPATIAPEILSWARELAPTAPVLSVRTMTDSVSNGANGLLLFHLGARLTAALGFLGLTLAVVGIYGVMTYAIGQRTQEIGVRMALGAQRGTILWMVSRQGLAIIATGLAIGLVAAVAAGRLVGEFLVGIGPADPLTYLTASGLLAVIALAACYLPARRAIEVEPTVALRYE
jgi:macrolide transport system ATP-binding/permease protein